MDRPAAESPAQGKSTLCIFKYVSLELESALDDDELTIGDEEVLH
jgi:hypothetical protein